MRWMEGLSTLSRSFLKIPPLQRMAHSLFFLFIPKNFAKVFLFASDTFFYEISIYAMSEIEGEIYSIASEPLSFRRFRYFSPTRFLTSVTKKMERRGSKNNSPFIYNSLRWHAKTVSIDGPVTNPVCRLIRKH